MYGEDFVALFQSFQRDTLRDLRPLIYSMEDLNFPPSKFSFDINQVVEYFKKYITLEDLKDFDNGHYFDEHIINIWIMLLRLFNKMSHDVYVYNLKYKPDIVQLQPKNILFLNTFFARKLQNPNDQREIRDTFIDFFERNNAIMPLFFNSKNEKQTLLVSFNPKMMDAELFIRPNDSDNQDISVMVLDVVGLAAGKLLRH